MSSPTNPTPGTPEHGPEQARPAAGTLAPFNILRNPNQHNNVHDIYASETAQIVPVRNQPIHFQQEPSLLEYWRIIRRHKGALIVAATLGLITGALFTFPQTPIYQAKTSLEIQDLNQDFLGMKSVQQVSDVPTGNMIDIQTQIRILQSETLKNRTGEALTVKRATSSGPPVKEDRTGAWRKVLGLGDSEKDGTAQEQAIKYAKSNLKARAAGQTRIIEVLVDAPDPRIASEFANTLTNEFIEQNLEARWNSTQRTSEWLSKQLEELKIKLERSEDALQAYARKAGLLFIGSNDKGDRASVSEDKLKQLQLSLSAASADRISKQSRFELAKSAPQDSLPDILNDSSLRDYQSKLTEIRRQMSDVSTIYSPEYKKVKQLAAQEKILETALASERTSILQRIANDFQESTRREKMLEADYLSQTGVVTNQNDKAIQYNILKREVDTSRNIYEALLQRVKESSIAAAMKASNVRIVDSATVPFFPYKPSIPINCGVGLLAGTFLGLSFIVMKERANKTFQEPGEVKDMLGIPELGVIPNSAAARVKKSSLRSGSKVLATLGALEKTVELVTWQDKPGIQAEAFRATLMSILFANQQGRMPRTMCVTSPGPGEGKTTTTCNLAIAIAELNTRVLLIDGDLRKPRIHNIFGLESRPNGFAPLLKNPNVTLPDAMAATQPSGVATNLDVLPAGPGSIGATTFLYTPQFQKILDLYLTQYDTVLIDTPPMLQIPDARVIGRHVEGTVLVVRSNKTTKEACRAAQYRLYEDGVSLFGVVMNDWNPKFSTGGYYGYYYKSYYDSYHGKEATAARDSAEVDS